MRGIAHVEIPGAKISVCHSGGGMFAASGNDHHVDMSHLNPSVAADRPSGAISTGTIAPLSAKASSRSPLAMGRGCACAATSAPTRCSR
jgi:hypothetical protein